MFLGLPDPDSPNIKKNTKNNIDSYFLLLLYDFISLKNDVNVPHKVIR